MFLQEKVEEINQRLKLLRTIENIVIWGAGQHTCKLFEWTKILTYDIKSIVDISEQKQERPCFGFVIQDPKNISWSSVGAVVISVPGQELQITNMLKNELGFLGQIVTFYENNKCTPFYLLYDQKMPALRFFGDYKDWNSAYNECQGYESANILNTVADAINRVIQGDAEWERDGCLFYEQKYVYRICAAILRCAIQNENRGVRILDVGGALGSTYFQNRKYLTDIKNLEYVIAEQENFAKYGHQKIENEVLKFINSEDNWEEYGRFDIVLLSGSLPCISQYEEILLKTLKIHPKYIIIDRTMVGDRMRICREIVPEHIYKGSYPIRIFSENQINNFFKSDYVMIEKDVSSVQMDLFFEDAIVSSKYYVFEEKSNR